jgi:hypothetical protein
MVMKTCQSSIKQSTQQRGREKEYKMEGPQVLGGLMSFSQV